MTPMSSFDFDRMRENLEDFSEGGDPASFVQDKKGVMRGSELFIANARERKKQDKENYKLLYFVLGKTGKLSKKSIYSCWEKYL